MSSVRDVYEDARERYARALELAKRIRVEWARLGCPLTTDGGSTGKAVVAHPVLLLLNVERDAQHFSHEVAVQKRKPFAV
jgi:predicted TPR repeat methyltransferase